MDCKKDGHHIFANQMYQIIRRILFLLPAETAHYFSMNCLKAMCSFPFLHRYISRLFQPQAGSLATKAFGLNFTNPVGLGAGFDKNAKY
jgi:dihydroorotate dehydrogenase